MSKDWFSDIVSFHKGAGQIPEQFKPHIVSASTEKLRRTLVEEEVHELFEAMYGMQLDKIADGIVDSIVVLIGTAVAYGIDIRPIWDEIHKTNMAKFRGGSIREDGKVLKPPDWQPPDVLRLIKEQQ